VLRKRLASLRPLCRKFQRIVRDDFTGAFDIDREEKIS
jgi:hypothetical protein